MILLNEKIVLIDGVYYKEIKIANELHDFEPIVLEHLENIFGEDCRYYPKKMIKSFANNSSIPDGFVIDMKNKKWYILECKLLCDDAIKRIPGQLINYKGAIKNLETKKQLLESMVDFSQDLYELIMNKQPEIVIVINSLDGEKGIKFKDKVKTTDEKVMIIEYKTYTREFVDPKKVHLHIYNPLIKTMPSMKRIGEETWVETQHRKSSDTVKTIYQELKKHMLLFDAKLIFNPTKYYISIKKKKNFAYVQFRRKKIRIVVMLPLKTGMQIIKKNEIIKLSQGIQGFYGGECFEIIIEKIEYLDEIIKLLKTAYEYAK